MAVTDNINDHFFSGSYKHAWKGISPHGLTVAETDFIIELAELNENDSVLDLMCGYGRHSLELARRGIRVEAIDNLADYIDEIQATADSEKLEVKVRCENVVSVKLGVVYDAVVCMGNSFSFFDRENTIKILHNISNHLKPGGELIINSWMVAEIAIRHFREKDWHYAGEYKCVLDYQYLFNPSRIESEQTIISNEGQVEVVKGIDYIYSIEELEQMFAEVGLRTTGLYSTPRKRKFNLGDSQIYIVAEKIRIS